jgi:uncharacterized membrane protein HdeD (DUF308 family)
MAIETLLGQLSKNWGWIVLRGVAAIAFGLMAFAWPGLTLTVLVLVWGAYALFDGLLALMTAFQIRVGGKPMWPLAVLGLIGIAVGLATFAWPQITAVTLLALIATWAILTGILEIVAAVRFRKVIAKEWLMALAGILSIAFGVLMIARPGAGALAVVWIIGWYAILFGITLTILGFRIKGLAGMVPKTV